VKLKLNNGNPNVTKKMYTIFCNSLKSLQVLFRKTIIEAKKNEVTGLPL